MPNYPIPTHLKNLLSVDVPNSVDNGLSGNIICPCGCSNFNVYHNLNREYNPSIPYVESESLKVLLKCTSCNTSHILLDAATQGYDGFVCHDGVTAKDDTLEQYYCDSCESSDFQIYVDIEVEDYDQFIDECVEEFPDKFSPEDYVDAFNWIVITLTCNNCKEKIELVDLELS